ELWQPGPPPHPGAPAAGARPAPATELQRGPATVVVAGDGAALPGPAGDAIRERVQQWGWPVLAEPSSGLRGSNWAVPAGHVLVRNPRLAENIERVVVLGQPRIPHQQDRKSTRLNSSHVSTSYAVFCLVQNN